MLSSSKPGRATAKDRATKFIYASWNIWEERFWRLFDNEALTASQLQKLIREDVAHWHWVLQTSQVLGGEDNVAV
jgi:hypothetical protein